MHRDEGIHLKWEKLPKIVHYVLYVHFAFPVVVLCDRKLLSRLPGICFYTPYLPSTYFAIKSCLSPLPGIYFYTPLLPGTVLQKKKKEVNRFITYVQRFIIYNWWVTIYTCIYIDEFIFWFYNISSTKPFSLFMSLCWKLYSIFYHGLFTKTLSEMFHHQGFAQGFRHKKIFNLSLLPKMSRK